jgi:hypothetical protein
MSMARLWRDQDKREEARDLLAPVYGERALRKLVAERDLEMH